MSDKIPSGNEQLSNRTIGWWGVAAAAVGLVVAASTFVSDFTGWATAGPAYIIALAIGFLMNIFVVFAYAELTTTFPKAGQVFEFTKQAFTDVNRNTSLVLASGIGVTYWLVFGLVWAGEATAGASAMVNTLNLGTITPWIIGINLLALAINLLGLKPTVIMETILVILMVGIRAGMGVAAFFGFNQLGHGGDLSLLFNDFSPFGLEGILAASTLGVWAFIGLEFATPLVEEVKNPSKNIPKGMTIGGVMILVMALIMGIGIITTFSPIAHQEAYLGNSPQITIAGILWGSMGENIAAVASFAATLGSLLVAYAAIPRIVYAMAREGLMPKSFAWVHPKYDSPWVAILATGLVFMAPVLFSNQVVELISAAAAVWMLVYIWVLMLVLKMRITHPDTDRPFSVNPAFYVAAVLLILLVLWKAYQGAYHLVGIALAIFVIGFGYATLWMRFTNHEKGESSERGKATG